jgi:hypothetical protein
MLSGVPTKDLYQGVLPIAFDADLMIELADDG